MGRLHDLSDHRPGAAGRDRLDRVAARKRAGSWGVVTLIALILVGVVATALARPERFRQSGVDLAVVEVDGALQTKVAQFGLCLSLYRQIGPLSYIVGNDLFPGDGWDRGPFDGCEAVGLIGSVKLPPSVLAGDWMFCGQSFCHQLTPSSSS